jgi:hypothetical protein
VEGDVRDDFDDELRCAPMWTRYATRLAGALGVSRGPHPAILVEGLASVWPSAL